MVVSDQLSQPAGKHRRSEEARKGNAGHTQQDRPEHRRHSTHREHERHRQPAAKRPPSPEELAGNGRSVSGAENQRYAVTARTLCTAAVFLGNIHHRKAVTGRGTDRTVTSRTSATRESAATAVNRWRRASSGTCERNRYSKGGRAIGLSKDPITSVRHSQRQSASQKAHPKYMQKLSHLQLLRPALASVTSLVTTQKQRVPAHSA